MADENVKRASDPVPPASVPAAPPPAPGTGQNPPLFEAIAVQPAPAVSTSSPSPSTGIVPASSRVEDIKPAPSTNSLPAGPLHRLAHWWRRPAQKGQPADTLREVLETIVFVVVLVVLLKSFAAEAFVIPTGSMATTLLGYNKHVTCPQCGATFPLNCSEEVNKKQGGVVIDECTCYNCRYKINFDREKKNPDWKEPSISSGDRVLVAKFLSDLGVMAFKPLDVVVFKFPEEPLEDFTPKNYIKRLIGLGDQVIGIYYGDIYVATRQDLEKKGVPFTKEEWLKDEEKYRGLLEEEVKYAKRRRMLRNHPDIVRLLKEGSDCFHIMRKPPDKILALLRPVYDNDHQARDLAELLYAQRWAAEVDAGAAGNPAEPAYVRNRQQADKEGNNWKLDKGNSFSISGRQRDAIAWLRYRNVLRRTIDKNNQGIGSPEPITDFLSYNTGNSLRNPDGDNRVYRWVGDLILECDVKVEKPEGEFILELSKGIDRFQARWELSSGKCTLFRGKAPLDSKQTSMNKAGTYHLRFANVDQRLTVWVDSRLPFDDGVSYPPPREQGPTEKNDLEPASIGVSGPAALSVQHLKLGRDTYYTLGQSSEEGLRDEEWSKPATWQNYSMDATTLYVQPKHYLCLGDNSPASSDSRSWDKEGNSSYIGGLVPEELMLGRALAIYWPLSRFGRIK